MSSTRRSASIIPCTLICAVFFLYLFALQDMDLPNDTSSSSSNNTCAALLPEKRKKLRSKPMWVASFPGSGAELFRQLMARLTDQPTVDAGETKTCEKGQAVACKTHWPTIPNQFPDPAHRPRRQSQNVIVLVRNPVHAIPSWYNQIYEAKTNAPFHSKQAPRANWIRWSRSRYDQIESKFKDWTDMILYWLESPYYDVDLFVPYEQMVDPTTGPKLLKQVTNTLQRSHISTVIPDDASTSQDTIDCLWQDTVQRTASMKRKTHKYNPPYTREQQRNMLSMLDEFVGQVAFMRDEDDLVEVLMGYRQDIENNLVIEDE